jgi:hypothetical protein
VNGSAGRNGASARDRLVLGVHRLPRPGRQAANGPTSHPTRSRDVLRPRPAPSPKRPPRQERSRSRSRMRTPRGEHVDLTSSRPEGNRSYQASWWAGRSHSRSPRGRGTGRVDRSMAGRGPRTVWRSCSAYTPSASSARTRPPSGESPMPSDRCEHPVGNHGNALGRINRSDPASAVDHRT